MHFLRILDRGTDIYAAVFVLDPYTDRDRTLMDSRGWGQDPELNYLFLMNLSGPNVEVNWDSYNWGGGRTLSVAHHYLQDVWRQKGFEHIKTLTVVDVDQILKERNK
jgi:hypothetical protein